MVSNRCLAGTHIMEASGNAPVMEHLLRFAEIPTLSATVGAAAPSGHRLSPKFGPNHWVALVVRTSHSNDTEMHTCNVIHVCI